MEEDGSQAIYLVNVSMCKVGILQLFYCIFKIKGIYICNKQIQQNKIQMELDMSLH